MSTASFQQLYPILGTRDTEAAIWFYVEQLGFSLSFRDDSARRTTSRCAAAVLGFTCSSSTSARCRPHG